VARSRVGTMAARELQQVQASKTLRQVATALQAVQMVTQAGDENRVFLGRSRSIGLEAARAAHKERVHAVRRSQHFTCSLAQKIEELREDLASCSTSSGGSSLGDTSPGIDTGASLRSSWQLSNRRSSLSSEFSEFSVDLESPLAR